MLSVKVQLMRCRLTKTLKILVPRWCMRLTISIELSGVDYLVIVGNALNI